MELLSALRCGDGRMGWSDVRRFWRWLWWVVLFLLVLYTLLAVMAVVMLP